MTPDVRDQSVAAWLDSAIGGLEPDPDRRLPDVRRKGRARRTARWTAIVASLAVFLAAVGFTAVALRRSGPELPASAGRWLTYRSPDGTFTIRYPERWHVQPYRAMCGRWLGPGVFVANVDFAFRNTSVKDGCTNQWRLTGLPNGAAVVDVEPAVIGPPPRLGGSPTPPDTRFPLSIDRAPPAPGPTPGILGGRLTAFTIPVRLNGQEVYEVQIWFGPHMSAADRDVARRVVASIRFATARG